MKNLQMKTRNSQNKLKN